MMEEKGTGLLLSHAVFVREIQILFPVVGRDVVFAGPNVISEVI